MGHAKGTQADKPVFPQLVQVLPHIHECFYKPTETHNML